MSFTESTEVFAGVREEAINDFLQAFGAQRPRYLAYGSPAFVPVTTVAETSMGAIPFPGVPGGIQWRVRLNVPRVDLFKQTMPLPPELILSTGQFSARVGLELCLDCRRLRIDPRPPGHFEPDQPPPERDEQHPISELTCARLQVFVVGHIERVLGSDGREAIAFAIDKLEIVDVAPAELESLLECLLFMVLQAVFANFRLPIEALRLGAFQLLITQGPLIEDDQVKVRGSF